VDKNPAWSGIKLSFDYVKHWHNLLTQYLTILDLFLEFFNKLMKNQKVENVGNFNQDCWFFVAFFLEKLNI